MREREKVETLEKVNLIQFNFLRLINLEQGLNGFGRSVDFFFEFSLNVFYYCLIAKK
jgi:hypothetical protein